MWNLGYILGFISRLDAQKILQDRVPGTFLIRFSDSNPGRLAISFTYLDCGKFQVANYLITNEEVKNLPDTLRMYSNLHYIVRKSQEAYAYFVSSKDSVFSTFYSKISDQQNEASSGYLKKLLPD